ncbi:MULTISPECIES: amidohydrolase [unclassified Brevundimonas]|uniref:amidohydrolase n=1 Tax=unclassified Brevundimonas TaxID=2622653 RepID=UPI000CFE2C0D|nr:MULTISPECIES: amidohydrolase [unclassified Brevundimonas]PRA33273.1 amidohydrolase [Brevundimonas sp. MYb27]PQZ83888.1 amidohydrolase [Brevundimonas sp. MYb31]PRB13817.1 amidohydrolase [Brevundimonas sp. MYb52]PRB34450.1 amidohydrolase [Brevundimonas sp. MYb46]PRB53928.1 amidohydrolase [Brevundimonas sp. MYb33]
MIRYALKAIPLGAALMAAAAPAAFAQSLLIRGGTIYTGAPDQPTAEQVIVRDGRILSVGPETAVAGPADMQVIDLKGATLFPGFTDGHAHLDGIGWREMTLNLEGSASVVEAMQRLSDWAKAHPEGVIVGRGWIETHWPEKRFLTAADLDAAAPGRIVLLTRADGHAVAVSSAAMTAAGINASTPSPSGGDILKGADGQPTGLLIDASGDLISGLAPQADAAATRAAYRAGFGVYARYGWTGIHFMSAPWKDVPLLEQMAQNGEAPVRVYNSIDMGDARALMAGGPREAADGRIITRAIKFYADGALGSRGAMLFEPYSDRPDTHGLMRTSHDEVMPLYQEALRTGIQIATHAIGDKGNHEVAAWYEEALRSVPKSEWKLADPRWRIEHAQIIRPSDYHYFDELPIIASMQPSHAIGDLHFAADRLGDARLDGAYAWHTLVDRGVIVVGGSDAPVERGDPLIEFYAAVARRDLNGFQGPDWRPNEAVDRATALKMFTLWPAYASFRENELGTIEVGKRADFTAFNIDLMTVPAADIPKGHAVLTVVDGQVVYQAD